MQTIINNKDTNIVEIDLVGDLGYTEKDVEEMSDGDAESNVADYAWDRAKEMIDSYAEPDEEKNQEKE